MTDRFDIDSQETQEWLDSIDSVIDSAGSERATDLLNQADQHAKTNGCRGVIQNSTPYTNTISPNEQPEIPISLLKEEKRTVDFIRWNAMLMVSQANHFASELGGHISTYASCAFLYEVGLNHFFRGNNAPGGSDLIFFQGHSTPGLYARAFLEGRLDESKLKNFRQESQGQGLSSYPHPWLMSDFWSFPTVSMGLGPLMAIYQARFMRYLENRELIQSSGRKVWAFLGDGETDEPESLGCLSLAAREKLDNLIFVVNCNLQRLDGPVRGNGKIIQELESIFHGAGWNVMKVIWGSDWDEIFKKDKNHLLLKRMMEVVDGEYQNYKTQDGAYVRKHFFGKYPELLKLVEDLSDKDIFRLRRGGHDPIKIYSAYHKAVSHQNQPTVILVKTIKGYGLGNSGESVNVAHSKKKLSTDDLRYFRDRFDLPFDDDELKNPQFYHPGKTSPEYEHMMNQRKKLGGFLPERVAKDEKLETPSLEEFKALLEGSADRTMSSTMSFVRILGILMRNRSIKDRIVPIVPDEARTFGMEGLFRQIGIYASDGQLYEPEDRKQVMWYREDKKGQVLQEGINEAGSMASWMAAGSAYCNHNLNMIPFYTFYSMFGTQRVGDLFWAAADMQCRGFLMGATAGRTTLAGEGLQHQDGHTHLFTANIPNCMSYDPAYGYELAVIIRDGIKRMYHDHQKVFYYITIMNDNYLHPKMPKGVEDGIVRGMYCLARSDNKDTGIARVQLLGSGSILPEVVSASKLLKKDWGIESDLWSVTSFSELRKDGHRAARYNLLHPKRKKEIPYITKLLAPTQGPIVAVTDYVAMHANQIREFIPRDYRVLGTDGFGRSDTRKALRSFFEVDQFWIVLAALYSLYEQKLVTADAIQKAIKQYNINPEKVFPLDC